VLGPVFFLIYCTDIIAVARRHGLEVHSYADDTELYFHADPSAVGSKVQKLVTCVGDIGQWMCAYQLKLNRFICRSPENFGIFFLEILHFVAFYALLNKI